MAATINEIRTQYAHNREELLESIADTFGLDLSEWTFTEVSAKEQPGIGNDVLIIFDSTLSKEGETSYKIQEIINYHRLDYSYCYGLDVIEAEEEEA